MNIDTALLKALLSQQRRQTISWPDFRPAAVLVPLLETEAGNQLLFTVRSEAMKSHAGQIAFPGGRLDEGESIEAAAVRETHEEIGVQVDEANILGYLDDWPSPYRYSVTPVIARVAWPQDVRLNPAEVDEVFTVPLKDLLAIQPYREKRSLEGETFYLYFYPWQDKIIWGLTGNVVHSLLTIIQGLGNMQGLDSSDT